jgi:hypothetical protein
VIQLLDDQLLGNLLRGGSPPDPQADIFTTGYWYVRLCQAVIGSDARTGALSKPFAALPEPTRGHAIRALWDLPDSVGLVSLRELAPLIGQLRRRHSLNILGMEVLAAAVHLGAYVYLSSPAPSLVTALERESCRVEEVG